MKPETSIREGWRPGLSATLATAFMLGGYVSLGMAQQSSDGSWFGGTWDSTIYNRAEKPHTVGVRVEVVDAETDIPISDVSVKLAGNYLEEAIGPFTYPQVEPRQPQFREFELSARTGRDGVVVFGLQWQKQFPWLKGRPQPEVDARGMVKYKDVHSQWTRPVDDVEKVRVIEIRHPGFRYVEVPFDFSHLLQVDQNMSSELQEPRTFEAFKHAWHQEVANPNVPFCVLDLSTGFSGFQDKCSEHPEFFQRIRQQDFGTVYTAPYNWFSKGEYPQSECGPYLVYLLRVGMERVSGQINVIVHDPRRAELFSENEQAHVLHPADSVATPPLRNEDHSFDGRAEGTTMNNRTERGGQGKHVDGPDNTRPYRQREMAGRRTLDTDRIIKPAPTTGGHQAKTSDRIAAKPAQQEENRPGVDSGGQSRPQGLRNDSMGLSVTTLTGDMRKESGLYLGTRGALVVAVDSGSAASRAGIREGMVIEHVEYRAVGSDSEFASRIKGKKPGDQFLVGVWSKGPGGKWERARKIVALTK